MLWWIALIALSAFYSLIMLAIGFNLRIAYEVMTRIDNPADYKYENNISLLCRLIKELRKQRRSLMIVALVCFTLFSALAVLFSGSSP